MWLAAEQVVRHSFYLFSRVNTTACPTRIKDKANFAASPSSSAEDYCVFVIEHSIFLWLTPVWFSCGFRDDTGGSCGGRNGSNQITESRSTPTLGNGTSSGGAERLPEGEVPVMDAKQVMMAMSQADDRVDCVVSQRPDRHA